MHPKLDYPSVISARWRRDFYWSMGPELQGVSWKRNSPGKTSVEKIFVMQEAGTATSGWLPKGSLTEAEFALSGKRAGSGLRSAAMALCRYQRLFSGRFELIIKFEMRRKRRSLRFTAHFFTSPGVLPFVTEHSGKTAITVLPELLFPGLLPF